MEEGESVLEAIYEGDGLEDVEMLDVEEGELIAEQDPQIDLAKSSNGNDVGVCEGSENQSSQSKNDTITENKNNGNNNCKKKKNKKKRKRRGGLGPNVTDINRFVLDICRRLKEKKSYMVYTAVGCLGVSRLNDLVKEVDAVQSCGGQLTADGGRFRTGGGILWNIIKSKEPLAYKEIMKKAKEFEKQFKQQNVRQGSQYNKEGLCKEAASLPFDGAPASVPVDSQLVPQDQHEQSTTETKRVSVHDRVRIPVSYDDIVEGGQEEDTA